MPVYVLCMITHFYRRRFTVWHTYISVMPWLELTGAAVLTMSLLLCHVLRTYKIDLMFDHVLPI